MADGIFDQRLKQKARDESVQRCGREIRFDGQAILESDPLDVQIEMDQFYFAAQRNLLGFPSGKGLAQKFAQVGQHRIRFFYPVLTHQDDDGIERVEQEMGMKLHLERAQPRLRELIFELSRAQLELRRQSLTVQQAPVVANAVLDADNQPINDHIQMEVDWHDGAKGSAKPPREPRQAEHRRDPGEQDFFDQRETDAPHQMDSATAPPVSSLDLPAACQPPDERSEK